jgi:hypothetical protein
MDRDPSENIIDEEDRTGPSDGRNETGTHGDERVRREKEMYDDQDRPSQPLDKRKDANNGVN